MPHAPSDRAQSSLRRIGRGVGILAGAVRTRVRIARALRPSVRAKRALRIADLLERDAEVGEEIRALRRVERRCLDVDPLGLRVPPHGGARAHRTELESVRLQSLVRSLRTTDCKRSR